MNRPFVRASVCVMLLALPAAAQNFTQRGLLETDFIGYPQTVPGDSGQAIGEALFRYEAFYKLNSDWQFAGGVDARADTHEQVDRVWELSWDDRATRRPSFAVRQLNATYSHRKLTLVLGKQFIRWGKADILNPTDRFAPQDYLSVVDSDFLAITAGRATYGGQSNTIDLVWAPLFTPSRVPLLDQRWSNVPVGIAIDQLAPAYPGGSQFGARWNHIGSAAEYSLSFYDGRNNLPLFDFAAPTPPTVEVQRYYPQMRMYGGDAAIPLKGVTVKAEAAYFTSTTKTEDEYALFVAQAGAAGRRMVFHRRICGANGDRTPVHFRFRPRPWIDARVSRAGGIHHRHQSERGAGNCDPAERRGFLGKTGIFGGLRGALAGDRFVQFDSRRSVGFSRPVPEELARNADASLQFLIAA